MGGGGGEVRLAGREGLGGGFRLGEGEVRLGLSMRGGCGGGRIWVGRFDWGKG